MTRTYAAAKEMAPRVNAVDDEIEKLTEDIESFEVFQVNKDFFDVDEPAQKALKEEYNGFLKTIKEINNDIKSRLKITKQAAGTTSPMPNFRLKELENIIENVGQKAYNFKSDTSESYYKMVRAIRRINPRH